MDHKCKQKNASFHKKASFLEFFLEMSIFKKFTNVQQLFTKEMCFFPPDEGSGLELFGRCHAYIARKLNFSILKIFFQNGQKLHAAALLI